MILERKRGRLHGRVNVLKSTKRVKKLYLFIRLMDGYIYYSMQVLNSALLVMLSGWLQKTVNLEQEQVDRLLCLF